MYLSGMLISTPTPTAIPPAKYLSSLNTYLIYLLIWKDLS